MFFALKLFFKIIQGVSKKNASIESRGKVFEKFFKKYGVFLSVQYSHLLKKLELSKFSGKKVTGL